jgi:hypothetical protein
MGIITSQFSQALLDELTSNILANTSQYFAFAANPIPYTANTIQPVSNTSYEVNFINDWQMLFGKKLKKEDIFPIINKYTWSANTVYTRWDNTKSLDDEQFYVISSPERLGGDYQVYICIDNSNGEPSVTQPRLKQPTTFQTFPDGYKWRYVSSIRSNIYDQFYTEFFSPVVANATIQSTAALYAGVEVVPVVNNGFGYVAINSGYIREVINSTAFAINQDANNAPGIYTNSSMYVYSSANNAYRLANIKDYIVDANNYKYVILDRELEINKIIPNFTQYNIAPQVKITSNCNKDFKPEAYSVVNTVNYSIDEIVVLNPGANVSWANVEIFANSFYGSGATAYCIVPPPGGHGYNPATQCGIKALSFAFYFEDSEGNTIPIETSYNKIGLIKNPYSIVANSSGVYKGSIYKSNTYNQLTTGDIYPPYTFSNNAQIIGETSGGLGIVVYQANDSTISFVGDYKFIDGENIIDGSTGVSVTRLGISKRPDVYLKDQYPLYVQNINNVERSNTQTESYRLLVQL